MKKLIYTSLTTLAFFCFACQQTEKKTDSRVELAKFKQYKTNEYGMQNFDSAAQVFSVTITEDFNPNNISQEILAFADTLSPVTWSNFSDQVDEFKYNLQSAPGTLVRLVRADATNGTRTFESLISVLKDSVNVIGKAPQNQEISEIVINNSKRFYLDFILGRATLTEQERIQFIQQDILYSSVADSDIDPNKVIAKLTQIGINDNINKFWVIKEAILESYTYKKFKFLGKEGKIRLPITAPTVDSDNATYKQTTDYKNVLMVRLVVRPAIAYRAI